MEKNWHPALLSLSNIKNLIPLVLDFENVSYKCWSALFRVTARAYNVLHHIDATIPTPTTESDPLLWAQLDAVVLSWIYTTISTDLLLAILDENSTAMQTWTHIHNLFQDSNHSFTPYAQKQRKLNINMNGEGNESEREGKSMTIDSISCLPDDVLVYVISFVGMKTAGRTCLLSKRWRYVWTHIKDLDFDDHATTAIGKDLKITFTNKIPELDNYVKWVNQVISANRAPYLNSFRIHFPLTPLYGPEIENWVKFAFSKFVRNLELDFWFASSRIGFNNIIRTKPASVMNTTLESLRLKSVCIDGPLLQWVFSNCLNLQHLSVINCGSSSYVVSERRKQKLVVSSLKLKHLEFYCSLTRLNFEALQISAPSLTSFMYTEFLTDVKYLNVPSFVDASFGHQYALHIFYNTDVLSGFSSQLKKLSFTYSETHYASRGFPTFVSVEQLEIISASCNMNLISLISLIEACPSLHTFKLKLDSVKQKKWPSREATTAHIDAIQSHQHLETVEYVGYTGCTSSANLALCLTKFAPMLKKFIFDPRPFQHVEHRYNIYDSEYKDNMATGRRYAHLLAKQMRRESDIRVVIL